MSSAPPPASQPGFFRPVQQAFLVMLLAVVLAGICAALYTTRWIVLGALLGIGLGVIISPAMRLLHDHLRIPRPVSAALFFVLVIGTVGGILYVFYTVASRQIVPLIEDAPGLVSQARQVMMAWSQRIPWLQNSISKIDLAEPFQRLTGMLASGLSLGATAIGGFFFVLFIAIYLAVNPRLYRDGLLSLFPSHLRKRVASDLGACAKSLRVWFFAQMIAAGIVGALVAAGLLAIGLDVWFAGGLLTFALDFVPYVGPFIAAAIIGLMTLGSEPEKLLWAMGVLLIMQQVESNLVIPMVMKGRVELAPIQLITLMLMFGLWFGFLGVLIAPPLLTVARTLYLREYVPWMNSRKKPAYLEPPAAAEPPPAQRSA